MIEVLEKQKERVYYSVEDIPIEKARVIRNIRYLNVIQSNFSAIREEIHELWKIDKKGLEWKECIKPFDRDFLLIFIYEWKKLVLKESLKFSKDQFGDEEQKKLIVNCLREKELSESVRSYFLDACFRKK